VVGVAGSRKGMERPDIDRVREELERLEESDEVERQRTAEADDADEDGDGDEERARGKGPDPRTG
jgi:hypothetical protein